MQPVSMIDADQEKTVDGEKRPEMQARADLPFAQGKTFVSLDDYLAFLKKRGATDVPWYREVAPGVYELVGRRGPGAAAHTYTRAQLMERFGFDR